MEKRQVIVVGAGPSGSTAAFYLAKLGVDVLLVDKEFWPRDKVCGDCQSGYCFTLYHEMGIYDEAMKNANVLLTGQQFSGVKEEIATFEAGRPISFLTRRYVIDDIVRRAATEKAGVDFRENFDVRDLIIERGYVKGVKAVYNGKYIEVRADAVILANGSHSVQAKKLGFLSEDPELVFYGARGYFENVRGLPETVFEEHYPTDNFYPSGYIWLFPEGNGLANVGIYITEENLKKGGMKLEDYIYWWRDHTKIGRERLGSAKLVGDIKGWRLPTCNKVGAYYGNGVLAAGDAGNFIQPHSGEGFAPAMNTGKVAAQLLAEALAKGDVSKEALSVYQKRLEEHEMAPGMTMKTYYNLMWTTRNKVCCDADVFEKFLDFSRHQDGYPNVNASQAYLNFMESQYGLSIDVQTDALNKGGH
ncbi:MAG: geranylgeranyl reductase family protein [Lachnospiraceae bacterium]|nr:geranylgeranyl reductase family protein [Lachnospiraceae bacterium]